MICPGPGGLLVPPEVESPRGVNLTPPVWTVEYPGPGLAPDTKLLLLVICVKPGILEEDGVLTKLLLFVKLGAMEE